MALSSQTLAGLAMAQLEKVSNSSTYYTTQLNKSTTDELPIFCKLDTKEAYLRWERQTQAIEERA